MRLSTKKDRLELRKAWISGRETEKYKNLEFIRSERIHRNGRKVYDLILWKNAAGKPSENSCYYSAEQRDRDLEFYKKMADQNEKHKKEYGNKDFDYNLANQLKRGDIFYTSWGYDQTNYDYVVVLKTSKTKKTVKCQRTNYLRRGEAAQSNLQEPLFCPFGDMFTLQVRTGENDITLVGSYPFCHTGTGSKRRGSFSRHETGRIYHETMAQFGH